MIPEFQTLDDTEIELVFKAPILVCILIAGADGTIDRKEIKEAVSITQKQKKSQTVLSPYFRELSEDFEDKIRSSSRAIRTNPPSAPPPSSMSYRGSTSFWKRLDKKLFHSPCTKMLKTVAEKVATSSGDFWASKR